MRGDRVERVAVVFADVGARAGRQIGLAGMNDNLASGRRRMVDVTMSRLSVGGRR